MPRNEAQTRRDLIDPALSAKGWTQNHVKVEVSTGGYDIVTRKRRQGRTDYLLRIIASRDTQPVAAALIEAKAEDKSPGFGLQQGKRDGDTGLPVAEKDLKNLCEEDKVIIVGEKSNLPFWGLEMIESDTGAIDWTKKTTEGNGTCYYFDRRHILYSKLRPYLNKVALPDTSGRCSTELIPLFPNNRICREYLAYLLRRNETVEYVMSEKTGSRMPRASIKYLLTMDVPLPPIDEQKRIAKIIETKLNTVEKTKQLLDQQLAYINAFPSAILRKAFNGEL
jgi:type I restriction enzyme S subunit